VENGLSCDKAFLFQVSNTDIRPSVKVSDPQKSSGSSGMKLYNFPTNRLRYEAEDLITCVIYEKYLASLRWFEVLLSPVKSQ
jgi:hypothetical protein